MSFLENGREMVLGMLREKATLKKSICAQTGGHFNQMKKVLAAIEKEYRAELGKLKDPPRFSFTDMGEYEAQLCFGGDTLFFTRHSNVFTFEPTHPVFQSEYVRENPNRAFCGLIQVHNFLYDSIKQQRPLDVGYLIARIFINDEGHFFVEGKRQLGFLYNDFGTMVLNDVYLRGIVESAMIYAIDLDLLVPPYEQVATISVQQKLSQQHNNAFSTGKRVGFKFQFEQGG
jgi:hypothetical protein